MRRLIAGANNDVVATSSKTAVTSPDRSQQHQYQHPPTDVSARLCCQQYTPVVPRVSIFQPGCRYFFGNIDLPPDDRHTNLMLFCRHGGRAI